MQEEGFVEEISESEAGDLLRRIIESPEWLCFVKSGGSREFLISIDNLNGRGLSSGEVFESIDLKPKDLAKIFGNIPKPEEGQRLSLKLALSNFQAWRMMAGLVGRRIRLYRVKQTKSDWIAIPTGVFDPCGQYILHN